MLALTQPFKDNSSPPKQERLPRAIVSFCTLNTLLKRPEKVIIIGHELEVYFSLPKTTRLRYFIVSLLSFYMLLSKAGKIDNVYHQYFSLSPNNV